MKKPIKPILVGLSLLGAAGLSGCGPDSQNVYGPPPSGYNGSGNNTETPTEEITKEATDTPWVSDTSTPTEEPPAAVYGPPVIDDEPQDVYGAPVTDDEPQDVYGPPVIDDEPEVEPEVVYGPPTIDEEPQDVYGPPPFDGEPDEVSE